MVPYFFCNMELMNIRILAIDQAKTTGYAIFDNRKLVEHGAIELGRRDDIYENILFTAMEKIRGFIDRAGVDYVVIEDIQQQRQNVKTYKKLAMLMGILICLFQEMNKPYLIVPPTRWKSFCGIKGRKRAEQKANTILFVHEKFNLDSVTEDMADAIALCWFAVNNIDSSEEDMS